MPLWDQLVTCARVWHPWFKPSPENLTLVWCLCKSLKVCPPSAGARTAAAVVAAAVAAAALSWTSASCSSGACPWAWWRCWSSDPARTWPTTAPSQPHTRGRRWSSTPSRVSRGGRTCELFSSDWCTSCEDRMLMRRVWKRRASSQTWIEEPCHFLSLFHFCCL